MPQPDANNGAYVVVIAQYEHRDVTALADVV